MGKAQFFLGRLLAHMVFFYVMFAAVFAHAGINNDLLTPEEKTYIQSKKSIRIGITDNEPPYSFYSRGVINGFSIDLLHIIEQASGLKFNFVLGSWFNVYSSFQNGDLDVIDQISFTEERSHWMLFTPAYHVKGLVLFMRANDIPHPFKGLASLGGKRVGIIRDIYYEEALRQDDHISVYEYDDYISLMKALSFGWVDAVVASEMTGNFVIRDNSLSGIRIAGLFNARGIAEEDFRLGISQQEPLLQSILTKLLKAVPAQTIEKLIRKWSRPPNMDNSVSTLRLTDEEQAFVAGHPTVSMGMLSDFSPYSFVSQGRQVGYSASLLRIISKRTGLKFSYVVDDWSHVFYLFKTGQIDAIANISYAEDRTKFTQYTDVYHQIPTVVFVRNDFKNYQGIGSLKGRVVGITRDVFYKKVISRLAGDGLREYDDHSAIMRDLSFGKLDAVVMALNTGNHYVRKLGLVNLVIAGEFSTGEIKAEDLRFGVRPDLAPLAGIINKALHSLSASDWQLLETAWLSPRAGSAATSGYTLQFSDKEAAYLKEKKRLILCVISDNLPFGKVESDGRYIGISADFMALFTKQLPIPVVVRESRSWAQLLEQIKQRQCDLCMDAMKTPDKQQFMDFTDPYFTVPNVIATSVNAPFIDDFRKFTDRPMGVIKASSISELLKSTYPAMNLVEMDSELDGIYEVQRGTLFGMIGTMTDIGYHLRQEKIVDIKIAGKMPYNLEASIGTRSDEPLLGDIFQKLVLSLSEKQRSQVMDHWLSVKVEQKFDYSPFWKALGVVIALTIVTLFWTHKVRKLNRKLIEANRALEELSRTDGLTRLFNRRVFDEEFTRIFNLCKRSEISFSVIILDIDYFKKVNDTHGHPAGDACLKRFGAILIKRFQRNSDIVCRFGGEEFGIICTGKDAAKVHTHVNALRRYMADNPVTYNGKKITFTISAGIYSMVPQIDTPAQLCLDMADKALYQAKSTGRNQVVDLSVQTH
ncbi:transporter substrate-binding domain-containing diguanylate cyclase [Desulfobacter curvatus]|uniref:transporter substrate-binding domain-containing diguanylate cyclase n=1 Tax=Desulfobacter curvatus TaxID=2290 RepID=UPI0003773A87|nr:transporter substrate-binding domain-containing protein [Desulfobacter curvatus]